MSKILKKRFDKVASYYVKKFCKKQGIEFEFWVGDVVGDVACFGDVFYFNFRDIIWDINSDQPKGLIIDWLYESLDNPKKSINYFSYTKGLRFEHLTKEENERD